MDMLPASDEKIECPSLKDGHYNKIREGEIDPYHGGIVHKLLRLEKNCVVYLTEANDVVWCSTNDERRETPEMVEIDAAVTSVTTMPLKQLAQTHVDHIHWQA